MAHFLDKQDAIATLRLKAEITLGRTSCSCVGEPHPDSSPEDDRRDQVLVELLSRLKDPIDALP